MPVSLPPSKQVVILNVDDTEAIRYARTRTLTQAGYRVREACTGEEALLMVATLHPQLIMLDVNLPGIDGLEVCRRIKADQETAGIMVLQVSSSRSSKMDVVTGLEGGADGYLIEPIDPLELVATVRALLRLAQRQEENVRLIRQLARSERQFIDATDAADCGLWDWDIPNGTVEWFGAHERLAGLASGTFSGTIDEFMHVLHADDRTRVRRKLEDMMARHEEQFADEYRFMHPDGSLHWMAGTGRFVYDDSGRAVRMTGVVQDVTARKQTEEQVALYRAIFLSAVDGIAIVDLDGRYIEQNHAHQALLGFSEDDLRGQTPAVHMGVEQFQRVAKELRETGRSRSDITSERKDGTPIAIGLSAFAVRDRNGAPVCYVAFKRDITERRRWEEARARLAAIVESSQDAIIGKDLSGTVTSWNHGAELLYGYTAAEMLGTPVARLIPAELRHEEAMILARVMQGERVEPYETVRLRKDGGTIHVSLTVSPVKDAEGRVIGASKIARDITHRRRAEERERQAAADARAAAEANAKFRTFFEQGSYFAGVMALDGTVMEANRLSLEACGYSREDIIGKKFWDCGWWNRSPALMDMIRQGTHAAANGHLFREVSPYFVADGSERVVDLVIAPVKDDMGRVLFLAPTGTDITERNKAEAELRASEEFTRRITDVAPSILYVYDCEERRNVWGNREMYEGLGYTGAQIEAMGGRLSEMLLHPEDRPHYQDYVHRVTRLQDGEAAEFEYRIRHADGSWRWLHSRDMVFLRNAEGDVKQLVGSALDITDRKQQEDELRWLKDMLELRVQERTQALLTSQERLRDLSAQLTMAEQRERQKLARDLHDYLAQMLAVGQMKTAMAKKQPDLSAASLAMIQDLGKVFQDALSYTRTLIADLSPPSLSDYDLSSALKWLAERMEKEGLRVDVEPDVDQVSLSEERAVLVFQCVRELLFNVLKHAGVDRATVQLVTDSSGELRVAVRDRGRGMSEDASRRAAEPGHLGLFAVRERMESVGGRVEVSSTVGKGTIVTLCLPVSEPVRPGQVKT